MPKIYCVRAQYGKYAETFKRKNYVAIGWLENTDLSAIQHRAELYPLYKAEYPQDTSNVVIGQQVGQIGRFLLELKAGEYVVVPSADTDILHIGVVTDNPYFFAPNDTECPFPHRKRVEWKDDLRRSSLSVPLQNTLRSSLTVFRVRQASSFFAAMGTPKLAGPLQQLQFDYYKTVLTAILQLDAQEFEILITHILTALGFEGSEHTGKPHDGGVDATGELNVANLAAIKLFVQAKRYKLNRKISARDVKDLRSNIPSGGQGAFITTAGFQQKAHEIAIERGFPRIGLINGSQLVDILVEHWEDIPEEFQEKLNLRVGLVPN